MFKVILRNWQKIAIVLSLGGLLIVTFCVKQWHYQNILSVNDVLLQKTLKSTVKIDQVLSYSPAKMTLIVSSDSWPGRLLVRLNYALPLMVNDQIDVTGIPQSHFSTDRSFANFRQLNDIWGGLEKPKIENTVPHRIDFFSFLHQTKDGLKFFLAQHFSTDVTGVLAGVLFGDTDYVSLGLKDDFRYAGLTHLMAISGENMTLLGQMMFSLFAFLSLRRRTLLVIIVLSVFTIFVGASASVLRAYLMAIFAMLALYLGRPYLARRSLIVVVLLVYIYNPYIVIYDIGFQLSCAATFGLLFFSPLLRHWFRIIPWEVIRSNVSITLAATVFTTPITLYYFGSFSLLAPLINIFFAPLLSLLFAYGYLFLILTIVPIVGDVFSVCLEQIMQLAVWGIHYSGQLATYFLVDYSPSFLLVVVFYGGLIAILSCRFVALEKFPG